jgi:hypothetical protein
MEPLYRCKSPVRRKGAWLPIGTLMTPSARELQAFGDRLERVYSQEELAAQQGGAPAPTEAPAPLSFPAEDPPRPRRT